MRLDIPTGSLLRVKKCGMEIAGYFDAKDYSLHVTSALDYQIGTVTKDAKILDIYFLAPRKKRRVAPRKKRRVIKDPQKLFSVLMRQLQELENNQPITDLIGLMDTNNFYLMIGPHFVPNMFSYCGKDVLESVTGKDEYTDEDGYLVFMKEWTEEYEV
jgi:hypothetical protein